MPNVEIVGVTEIVDKSKVPYIIVRQALPNGQEKFILKAGEGISFKVFIFNLKLWAIQQVSDTFMIQVVQDLSPTH